MGKTFNELFGDFFKRNSINPNDKLTESEKNKAKQLLDLLSRGNDIHNVGDDQEKEMDEKLGKPDKIEFFNEGNTFFERRIWHTPMGDIEKLTFTNDPSLIIALQPTDLKKQLDDAVENEEFEKACQLRDLINKKKKNKK